MRKPLTHIYVGWHSSEQDGSCRWLQKIPNLHSLVLLRQPCRHGVPVFFSYSEKKLSVASGCLLRWSVSGNVCFTMEILLPDKGLYICTVFQFNVFHFAALFYLIDLALSCTLNVYWKRNTLRNVFVRLGKLKSTFSIFRLCFQFGKWGFITAEAKRSSFQERWSSKCFE